MGPLQSPQIWQIASALGLAGNGSPVDAVLRYCDARVHNILADFPECTSPAELLLIMAAMLGTSFEEVHSDEGLIELQDRYCKVGEFGFASLQKDLDGEAYGVTYRRLAIVHGERAFVSVIDCRGNKALRSYFTKWHELGHLLILTDQQRQNLRRTHSPEIQKDPEEALIDAIAGQMGFHSRFLLPEIRSVVSFAEIDRIRAKLFPEASFQASANAYAKNHVAPCLLIEAKLALKKVEQAELLQGSFVFFEPATPRLRVQTAVASTMAKKHGLYIPRNFRVPEASIVHQVFTDGRGQGDALESLSLWESSDGKFLRPMPIHIEVRKHFGSVIALISDSPD